MAKDKPDVRSRYNLYLQKRRQYGVEKGAKSFDALL